VVEAVRPVSLKAVLALVPAIAQLPPPFTDRSTRYPVAPLLALHDTSIRVDDVAVALTPAGVGGAGGNVVAVAVEEGAESPPAFVAITR
jgi:hypothetical protein